eukprot:CAMPEP_0115155224 /NCGR_PEP_ID=MMETSP0227-20121206/67771_1 /TAXON_ID=89957 /ORGANISM="Polarella glacialis, Strain CCMP 1383" /LENGTH=137 /DNA_ID=CAMNT_0002566267 /DNA_START=177 /DNA_END=587 /DNA_ORIENTATION=+
MHWLSWSCCIWQVDDCGAAAGAPPSCLCTTSVWRGPMMPSMARLAMLMPTPVAMPEAIEPIMPDIMPPPAAGAAAGGAAAGAAAGGGAEAAAGLGGGALPPCDGAGAARLGAAAELRLLWRGILGKEGGREAEEVQK